MASTLRHRIEQHCRLYHSDVVAVRRHIHANPELAFEEYKTSEFICKKLDQYGIPYQIMAKTGIVAFIEGKKKDKVIALRADMDALPIQEIKSTPYKSKVDGVMHACGHDAHSAMLLLAGRVLNEMRHNLDGSIKLIFQPSEEKIPGGAKAMIEAGVLENPKVRHVIGQHVLPTMASGRVGYRAGKYMASSDELFLKIIGKGGHGATPDLNIDPVLIASHIVVAIQQVVSRMAKPTIPTVVSFGRFIANGHVNIIPDEANLAGILRTFDEEWRAEALIKITKLAETMAESMGAKCEVTIVNGFPVVDNDEELTKNCMQFSREFLGKRKVEDLEMRMTAEDFAYYGQKVPSTFLRLGTKTRGKDITNLHNALFDIDEDALYHGMGNLVFVAYRTLEELID
ncbi:MAG: N-acyl-L-amino acid amidohydrolase [Bacteroidetes bacterium 4572_112]|nr:MAG: N-acyl-L-amino acid amidohydrolase [Bacteroidetes bacterium 4572_112]